MKVMDNAGNLFPATLGAFGNKSAFMRPGAGPNMVSQVDVLVNGQSIYVQENHETVSDMYDMLTMEKIDMERAEREYGGGFYQRKHVRVPADRATDYTGDTLRGPNTMPSIEATGTGTAAGTRTGAKTDAKTGTRTRTRTRDGNGGGTEARKGTRIGVRTRDRTDTRTLINVTPWEIADDSNSECEKFQVVSQTGNYIGNCQSKDQTG